MSIVNAVDDRWSFAWAGATITAALTGIALLTTMLGSGGPAGLVEHGHCSAPAAAALITAAVGGVVHRLRLRRAGITASAVFRADDAVQQSLVDIIRQSNDAILLTDAEEQIIYANDRAVEIYGYSRDEFRALRVRDLRALRPDENRALVLDSQNLMDGKVYEIEALRKDGSTFLAEVSLRQVTADGQRFNKAIVRDVTKRKADEERLRQLSKAVDHCPAAIVITDRDGKIEYVNPRFCTLTGYSAEQAIGKNPRVLKSGVMDPSIYSELWQTITAGREWRGELCNRKRSGELFWESASISPIIADDGTIAHFVAVKEDVTERRQTELAIQRARDLLQNVIDSTPDWVVATDRDHRILIANQSVAAACGHHPREIVGRPAADWLPTGFRCEDETAEAAISGDVSSPAHRHEFEVTLPDGSSRWYQTYIGPLRDRQGEIYGALRFGHDVTEARRAERVREAMQIELQQAQRLESVGRLAAGIAHEINTPIQYIGDNMRFLEDAFAEICGLLKSCRDSCVSGADLENVRLALGTLDADYLLSEIPTAVSQTLEGIGRVAAIVRAMKEFSHRGSGEKTLVDINQAIESTVTVSRNEWKYVADVETRLDRTLPQVTCLPGEMKQVLLNLIVNAAHAIADSVGESGTKGLITVSTTRWRESLEIRVTDTGTGIPERLRDRIFEPFFTTKPVGKGTGQGLAISRSVVVDKHGGTIHFETEPGKGTTFVVRIPLVPTEVLVATPIA